MGVHRKAKLLSKKRPDDHKDLGVLILPENK